MNHIRAAAYKAWQDSFSQATFEVWLEAAKVSGRYWSA